MSTLLLRLVMMPAAAAAEPSLTPVRLAVQWLPQSQFAGYYMARDQGLYRAAGLDLTVLHAGPGKSSLAMLAAGEAEFATTFLADAIVAAGDPAPLTHLAQIVNRSNLMLVAWRDMGIQVPADLHHRKISHWQGTFSTAFAAFFAQHRIEPEIIPQYYSVDLFLRRGVAACAAMYYNEFHRIFQAGIDPDQLTVFFMRDNELNFLEDGLYALSSYYQDNRSVCAAFRQASLAGWIYARDHVEQTIDTVLRESAAHEVAVNRPHVRWMLQHILASVFADTEQWQFGELAAADYRRTVDALRQAALVADAPSYESFAPGPEVAP